MISSIPLAAMGMLKAMFTVTGSFVGSVQSKICEAGLQKLRRHSYRYVVPG
jgi:hypothetical protein